MSDLFANISPPFARPSRRAISTFHWQCRIASTYPFSRLFRPSPAFQYDRTKAEQEQALWLARRCFRERPLYSIRNASRLSALRRGVDTALSINPSTGAPWLHDRDFDKAPTSIRDLLSKTDHMWEPIFSKYLQERCDTLDTFAGYSFCDGILAGNSYREWTFRIVQSTLRSLTYSADSELLEGTGKLSNMFKKLRESFETALA